MSSPAPVFINFRNGDGEQAAAHLSSVLAERFGRGNVFRSSDSIPPGSDYIQELTRALRHCRVLLALIGTHWLTVRDHEGRLRIHSEDDWVRREIAEALALGRRVIPVLLDKATMPREADLPADIKALTRSQYLHLHSRDTESGFAGLIRELAALVPELREPHEPPLPPLGDPPDRVENRAENGGIVMAPIHGNVNNYNPTFVAAPPEPRWREYWHPERPPHLFTGRHREREALNRARDQGRTDLVYTVDGLGGVGKTALAVAWAEKIADEFPDGRLYLNFHSHGREHKPVTSEEALWELLRNTCPDMSAEKLSNMKPDDLVRSWRDATYGRRLVMVWDNVGDVSQIESVLVVQRDCATVVTSRGPLDLDGAHRFRLDVLPADEAADVFVDTAQGGFGLDENELPPEAVHRLVEADLRMPVLIVHHAKQVRSGIRSLSMILAEIEQLSRSDVHQALYDRFADSYRVLNTDRRLAFRVLGAHRGPFLTADAAAVVMGCDLGTAIDRFDGLVRSGMAERHPQTQSLGRPQFAYSAHDLIADFAFQLAQDEADEFRQFQDRLLDHYRERLSADFDLVWFEAEHQSALATALSGRGLAHAELARALGPHLMTIGRHADAVDVFEHAAERYAALGDQPHGRGHALVGLGDALRIRGEWDRAQEQFKQAVVIFEEVDDTDGMVGASVGMGHVARLRGDYVTAVEYFRKAAEDAEKIGDNARQARALVGWGHALRLQKHWDEAQDRFERAVEIGTPIERANGLRGIGDVLRKQDDLDGADARYEAAAALYGELGDKNGQANVLLGLGSVAQAQGRLDDAERSFGRSLEIFGDLGNLFGQGTAHRGIGTTARDAGDRERARRHWERALVIYEGLESRAARYVRDDLEGLG